MYCLNVFTEIKIYHGLILPSIDIIIKKYKSYNAKNATKMLRNAIRMRPERDGSCALF